MLLSVDKIPVEFKYLENNENGKGFVFVDTGATSKEKENLRQYDENHLKIYGYHLIQNYEDLSNG